MITTISKGDFTEAFKNSETYKNNFTYDGLEALFDYMEELEEGLGEQIEFDMVYIACYYTEFATAWDAMELYQPDDILVEGDEGDDLTEVMEKNEAEALRWLEDRIEVIKFDTGIIIRNF